jgi:hypothetical protein
MLCCVLFPWLQMRALPLAVSLTFHTIGEALLYCHLGVRAPVLQPLVVNGICWSAGALIDMQRRKLFLRSTSHTSC